MEDEEELSPSGDENEDPAEGDEVEDGDEGVEPSGDGDAEVGGGEEPGEPDGEQPGESSVPRPTGRELLELLAQDSTAQELMQAGLAELQARQAAEAAAKKDAEQFAELVKNEDYAGIGQAVVERQRKQEARASVKDDILHEEFDGVYKDIFAQPELQNLSAEEREKYAARNFPNDAAYVRALSHLISEKRAEARIEAEVEKRVKTRLEAGKNADTARKAATAVGKTPAVVGEGGASMSSSDRIRRGFATVFGLPGGDPEDDD